MRDRMRVLVVDDDPDVRDLLGEVLSRAHTTVIEAGSGAAASARLAAERFDVALVDLILPDKSGLDILRWARGAEIDTEFIVLTGHADVETAVEAMRLGAYHYIAKPWKNAELVEIVSKAAEKKALRRENVALREMITRRDGLPEVVGDSVVIKDVLAVVGRVAPSDSPVLIHGESGTGKELIARSIHLESRRATRPFVSVNCGALPDTLLESELFGHARGAFTGAVTSRVGLFEAAEGGTLFLDEIGEMSPAMQVRVLRALDSGEVRRVGEQRAFHVDVRIVAASAKNLATEAAEGRFRSDLFYRVSTVVLPIPPLRKRRGDISLLVRHFIAQTARPGRSIRLTDEAIERLARYHWPGNIRELRNVIERLQILHEGSEIGVEELPAELIGREEVMVEAPDTALVSLEEVERRHINRVLAACQWNKARAARVLEVDIKTLNKKIRDFNLSRPA
jgi:two-component system, NtrC family, response regulator AtoC